VAAAPVPIKLTSSGLPTPVSLIVSVPAKLPVAAGVNVTPTVQVCPDVTDVQVLLEMAKSPVIVTGETVTDALDLLVRVTVCGALVVPND